MVTLLRREPPGYQAQPSVKEKEEYININIIIKKIMKLT